MTRQLQHTYTDDLDTSSLHASTRGEGHTHISIHTHTHTLDDTQSIPSTQDSHRPHRTHAIYATMPHRHTHTHTVQGEEVERDGGQRRQVYISGLSDTRVYVCLPRRAY